MYQLRNSLYEVRNKAEALLEEIEMSQPEARIVRRIQHLITSQGGRCFKIHGGDNPYQEAGIPDILACYRGRFIGLEVKAPGGKLSRLQMQVLSEIDTAGGIAAVVDNTEQVLKILKRIDREGGG